MNTRCMPILEGFGTKLAATLTAGIVKAAGVRFGKKLATTEVENALERCGAAAVKALVEAGVPEGSELPREHLEEVLGKFAEDEVVHDVLAQAMREGTLAREEVAELEAAFEAEHPREVLRDFDAEQGIAAFVVAFVDQADEEEAFQGLIQTKELRAQTRTLREQLDEARRHTRLLEEVVQRLPDAEVDARDARTRYLKEIRKQCLILPLARRLETEGLDLATNLDQVYIELDTTTPKERPEQEPEPPRRRLNIGREKRMSALDAFTTAERMVLLGGAGSGKSTFAKAVLAQLAGSALEAGIEPPAGLSRDLLPVFLVLRRVSGRLQELPLQGVVGNKRARMLEDAVRDQILADVEEEYRAPEFTKGMAKALNEGSFVLVLDGLDEVPEDLRGEVREAVLAATKHYGPKKVLVTCRVLSYGRGLTLPDFPSHELAPLDEGKIRAFCHAWYRAQGDLGRIGEGRVETGGDHLTQQVLQRPLDELAENPLLLTTMAIIHTRKKALPQGRAQVYEDAIQLLVRDWQQEKKGEKRVVESDRLHALLSDDSRLWPTLERIAVEAHQAGGTSQEEAAGLPKEVLLNLLSPPEYLGSWGLAEEFLSYADQSAGLLVGLGGKPGQPAAFGFVHRTFQEYLAGRYLTRGRGAARNLRARAAEGDLWSLAVDFGAEALLHVDRNRQALLDLAFELATAKPQDTEQWRRQVLWGAKMAAVVGVEVVERDTGGVVEGRLFLETVKPRLVDLLGGDLPPVERAEAGRALAKLGDPRDEILTVDGMELCWVPGGRFVMGGGDNTREMEIPYEYWIGRYPVTWAQFWEFVECGGYKDRRYWPEALEDDVWKDGGLKYSEETLPITAPLRLGDPWDLENHPADVSWYEAQAFCHWLSERWHERAWLPKETSVVLPSEEEWEKAARGGLEVPRPLAVAPASQALARVHEGSKNLVRNEDPGRTFPWGSGFSAWCANTREIRIGTTTALGCFPDGCSPVGCEEMSGNVWERTRSLFTRPTAGGSLCRDQTEAGGRPSRVLRGGNFAYPFDDALCSSRMRNHLMPVLKAVGFRVSVSPDLH